MRDVELTSRLLEAKDRAAWERLWRGYQEFYGVNLSDGVTEETWRRILDDASPIKGLAAEQGGTVIGIAHVVLHLSTWHEAQTAYLQDLFVAPEIRGSGAGAALIEAATALAARHGARRLHWLTHETNARAIHLYEHVAKRSGFIQFARPTS